MSFITKPIQTVQHWASDSMKKRVYNFSEGSIDDVDRLGLKGANMCEMTRLGINVPPGFVITTDTCKDFFKGNASMPSHLMDSWMSAIDTLEKGTGKMFGGSRDRKMLPLILSVRSGTAVDMPSMMDSILGVGINDEVVTLLEQLTANSKFAYDLHRRFLHMYGNIVLKIPNESYTRIMDDMKASEGVNLDSDLSAESLRLIVQKYKELGEVPSDPYDQLRAAIEAVFCSFYAPRAVRYRKLRGFSDDFGMAVVVQSMVYGNLNNKSATGKMMTRSPDTGENQIYGEFLRQACGDDLVQKFEREVLPLERMNDFWPGLYDELRRLARVLETDFRDAQEVEFTVQNGDLWFLETMPLRRSSEASVKIAVDMVRSGMLTEREAVLRLNASQMHSFWHTSIDRSKDDTHEVLGTGLSTTSAGAAWGIAVFNSDDAIKLARDERPVILIRHESSADDAPGIAAADGIVTIHGGTTSAAAELARTYDKAAIVGMHTGGWTIDESNGRVYDQTGSVCIVKGQAITLDAFTGRVLNGHIATVVEGPKSAFRTLLRWADSYRRTSLLVSVDSEQEALKALDVRPDGIGLCRINKMLQNERTIHLMRGLIYCDSRTVKDECLRRLEILFCQDLEKIFVTASGSTVSVELLNESGNSWWCKEESMKQPVPDKIHVNLRDCFENAEKMWENNPALGTRGVRCNVLYPEFLRMQIRAILRAGCNLVQSQTPLKGLDILIPAVTSEHELEEEVVMIHEAADAFFSEMGFSLTYRVGTMIETPRACLRIDGIVKTDGLSLALFNMDRLTELVLGMSRDDTSKMISSYIQQGIIHKDPFKAIDHRGVGTLMATAIRHIRRWDSKFHVGVFGNQCGHPGTVNYLSGLSIDYLCCPAEHIPTVKVSTAQAYIKAAKAYERMWLGGDADEEDTMFPVPPFVL